METGTRQCIRGTGKGQACAKVLGNGTVAVCVID